MAARAHKLICCCERYGKNSLPSPAHSSRRSESRWQGKLDMLSLLKQSIREDLAKA